MHLQLTPQFLCWILIFLNQHDLHWYLLSLPTPHKAFLPPPPSSPEKISPRCRRNPEVFVSLSLQENNTQLFINKLPLLHNITHWITHTNNIPHIWQYDFCRLIPLKVLARREVLEWRKFDSASGGTPKWSKMKNVKYRWCNNDWKIWIYI